MPAGLQRDRPLEDIVPFPAPIEGVSVGPARQRRAVHMRTDKYRLATNDSQEPASSDRIGVCMGVHALPARSSTYDDVVLLSFASQSSSSCLLLVSSASIPSGFLFLYSLGKSKDRYSSSSW